MLVLCRVVPDSMSSVPTYTPGWRETMLGASFSSKETTRWEELGCEPPTFMSEELVVVIVVQKTIVLLIPL